MSDEEGDAFPRQTVEGGGVPAPEEPSARARMVTRRLREQHEAARRGRGAARRGRPGRKRTADPGPAAPPGWRTGPPVLPEARGRRGRRRRFVPVLGVVPALVPAVIAVRPSLLPDRLPGGSGRGRPLHGPPARRDGAAHRGPGPGRGGRRAHP
jgi:hypothetical protein